MDKSRVLVCSAWPYASGIPHLGNLVSSLLSGDVFTRYYRLRGKEVVYVSGTDAHGTKIEFEARKLGITPLELATRTHEKICDILEAFGIAFDNYTTTECETHKRFVHDIYLDIEKNGYIKTQLESRAYCKHCQRFLADRFISGTCPRCGFPSALGDQCDSCGSILEPEELVSPTCSFCGQSDIEFRETKHWYLDLPKLSRALKSYVTSRGFQGNVHLFTQQMIDDGLKPRAMTRDIDWGIPAPFEGAEGKVIYVWGEAALGYVSAVIEHFRGGERWKDFWFGDDVFQIYTIGKDNIPFHSLIFPGQLIASGRGYHLPDQIAATEYLNWIGGDSFSKTRGVGLYCDEALRVMDPEFWRFYLLYNRPEARDVNFSWEELEKAVNGILISNVANLINRVLSFVQTHQGGVIANVPADDEVVERLAKAVAAYEKAIDAGLLGTALRSACDLAVFGNEYFQRKRPWATKDGSAVTSAAHLVKGLAILLLPYVPKFASSVLRVLRVDAPTWGDLDRPFGGASVTADRVLLERIDVESLRGQVTAKGATPPGTAPAAVSFEEFSKLDFRVGVIREAAAVAGASRLYKLTVDLGTEARTCVAGIRESYEATELVGKSVVVVTNLEKRTIRGIESEAMLLAAQGSPLALIGPERPVEPGTPVG
ncbi:MAG: methionine--tRNA ligase [Candidatus Bipolaricaulota bacterium]|nr:methionine--tRNA ligase [Candidatus Bipolaricaulota bacterium]